MLRRLAPTTFLLLTLLMSPVALPASAQQPDREFSEMPIMVLYCDEDPGRLEVGGGKGPDPQSFIDNGMCTAAEGVALTFVTAKEPWDFASGDEDRDTWDVQPGSWFGRCDIDATGTCMLNSPQGFDVMLGVILHEATVKPGYEPAFFQPTTHNFTEFAGWGLALIPSTDTATPTPDQHQKLEITVTTNAIPTSVLTEWIIDGEHADTYLATDNLGVVSNLVAPGQQVDVVLMDLPEDAELVTSCAISTDTDSMVQSTHDTNELYLEIPDAGEDISCTIEIEIAGAR